MSDDLRPPGDDPSDLSTFPLDPAERRRRSSHPAASDIGRYEIRQRLGAGGMGEVFLAYDRTLSRQIALKQIRSDRQGSEETRRRFEVEARVTALLQHPSIVPVYDYVGAAGGAFYTMRPVEGLTLGQLVEKLREHASARAEWSTPRLLRTFLQACNAVAYAHSLGVIHRDLKPDNIMVGPFEEVLVLDWGVALLLEHGDGGTRGETPPGMTDDLAAETASRQFVGTLAYMAPEQLSRAPASFATDQFSLGVVLYELLTFNRPWNAENVGALTTAMQHPPLAPTLVQPTRGIPVRLDDVVLKALAPDAADRFESVSELSREVAQALEGRAAWALDEASSIPGKWVLAHARRRDDGDVMHVVSRGRGMRYYLDHRLEDNVRVDLDLCLDKGAHQLTLWLNAEIGPDHSVRDGYGLECVAGRRRTVSLLRSGRDVAGARRPDLRFGRWHHVTAMREADHLVLSIDGRKIYQYRDPIPLTGGVLGLAGVTAGARIRNLRVYSRGADATVSCLAVPAAFYNRGLFEEARSEYAQIAATHRGRPEARQARFRSALCMIEMARREPDGEMRSMWLDETRSALDDEVERGEPCALMSLGAAMLASELGDAAATHDTLRAALDGAPHDPERPTVHEWMLGRLHAAEDDDRRLIAELLPLAIRHCTDNWGRRMVREMVHGVRRGWETPSFMTGRGKFKLSDPASRAEAMLFCAFWAARVDLIGDLYDELVSCQALKPYHLSDIVFALLELGRPARARAILERVREHHRRVVLCQAALLASEGDVDLAASAMRKVRPDPTDRAFNSARLWVARSWFAQGDLRKTWRALGGAGPRDFFGREHRAWFALSAGDPSRAWRELEPLVERGDHLEGRNLTNLLYGICLRMNGRPSEADIVFSKILPRRWPRTWTLGSLYASGQLGGGDVDAWAARAFPWERETLRAHRDLLSRA